MPPETRWLLRDVTIGGERRDCRLAGGAIVELAPSLWPAPDEQVIDGNGGALLPGLADHHLHLMALAAARRSVDLAGGGLPSSAGGQPSAGTGWLRVIGAGTELSRSDVDRVWPDRPVRVQHRSGALWTLNSAAVDELSSGLTQQEQRTGQLWRADQRLRSLLTGSRVTAAELRELGQQLARYGLTHLTDATPDIGPEFADHLAGALPQHLLFLGEATGSGPHKHIIADHELPQPDGLTSAITLDHANGRPAAVHAVSAVGLAVAIAAFEAAGTIRGDRIEHAAVCSDNAAERLAELGVIVVTQPSLLTRHGIAYRAESDRCEVPLLWRYAGLIRAGVQVVLSSDAPYGDPNPWVSIRSATTRRLADGTVLGPDERVGTAEATASLLTAPTDPGGAPRQVTAGAPADLCLLLAPEVDPVRPNQNEDFPGVRATFIAGRAAYLAAGPR